MGPWRTIVDRIAPPEDRGRYAELIRLTGGEPTLHPEFSAILRYVDSLGIAHATFSTGRWTQPEKLLADFAQCAHLHGILISLHGADADSHNAFVATTPKAFTQTCANIELAAQAGLTVFTNTVLHQENCNQIEAIVELSQRLGAQQAVFNRYLGPPRALEPSAATLRAAIVQIEALQTQGRPCHVGNCVPRCFVENRSEGSNSGIEACAISPRGDVRPDNLTGCIFGNVLRQNITDIWQSETAQRFRASLPDACQSCVELLRCRGGARSVVWEHGGESDRLMRAPITAAAPHILEWHPAWKPRLTCRRRQESFGYLLTRYNWSIPVAFSAAPLLDRLDGHSSLAELAQHFGDAGLELLGRLYQAHCLEFDA